MTAWLSQRGVWLTWLLTRVLLVVPGIFMGSMRHDIGYYWESSQNTAAGASLPEYPYPMAVLFWLPAQVLNMTNYTQTFVIGLLVVDAAIVAALLAKRDARTAMRWVLVLLAVGPIAMYRFDLFVAAGLFLFLLAATPLVRSLGLIFGVAAKLWPLVLAAVPGPERSDRTKHLAIVSGGVFLLGMGTILGGGLDRLLSPFRFQSGRGIQIESFLGTIVGIARAFSPDVAGTDYRNGTFEYVGVLADHLTSVLPLLTVLGITGTLGVLWLLGREGGGGRRAEGVAAIALILMVTSPVISPQYVLWLLAPLVLVTDSVIWRLTLGLALATQLLYPWTYDAVFGGHAAVAFFGMLNLVRFTLLITLLHALIRRILGLTTARSVADRWATRTDR